MESVTKEVASIVSGIEFEDLPQEVVHESKNILLDSIGCALAGLATEKGKLSVELARRLAGSPEATIIGIGGKVLCTSAAFANGELINALDYDNMLIPPAHISPFVLPASLALGEHVGASGKDLILAIAISHEISTRLAVALYGERSMLNLPVSGYSLCIFGGAAAAGKILKLDAHKMSHALGIAGHFCPVPIRTKWGHTMPPPMIKYLSGGWMGESEITAALLAETGYTGDNTILDGEYGFWRFYGSVRWEPESLMKKLGQEWRFPTGLMYKSYPCCGVMNASLGLFIKIINENNLTPDDIEKVTVLLSPASAGPLWQNREVRTEVEAQFSIPYVFSVAAHRVRIGSDWQNIDTIKDPKIIEFMKKVSFDVHPELGGALSEDTKNRMLLTTVEVQAKGSRFREEKRPTKGASYLEESEMKGERLVDKFRNNASRVLTWDKIDKAVNCIRELEKIENVSQLLEQVAL